MLQHRDSPRFRIVACAADDAGADRIATSLARGPHKLLALTTVPSELPALARALNPDAILLGHHCEPFDRLELVPWLRRELNGIPFVVIATALSGTGLRRLLRAEVDGVVLDEELEEALLPTLTAAMHDRLCIPSAMRAEVGHPALSHREKQILQLVREGLTNSQIADRLYLSESTIRSHLASSFRKLDVSSRQQAVRRLFELDGDQGARRSLLSPRRDGRAGP